MTTAQRLRVPATIVLTFALFMDLMDVTIVNVALPAIRTDLDASPSQLEWVVGGYILAFASVLITGGRLGDRFGRRHVFVVGIIGFTVASLVASLAQDAGMLVAARVVQGLFAGVMVPQVLASVQSLFAPEERAPVFGAIGMVTAMAAVIGPVLGGWLVSSNPLGGEWRAIFYINVPVGVVIVIAAMVLVPNTTVDRPSPIDPIGVGLAVTGILLLVFPLIEGRQLGWPAWSFVLMALSPVVLAVFVVYERRHGEDAAMMPMRLFADRGFVGGVTIQFLFAGSINSFFLILALYVQTGLGFSAIAAGVLTLPFSVGAVVVAGVAATLVSRLGRVLPFVGGLLIAGGTAATIAVVNHQGGGYSGWDTVIPMAIGGVGLGLTLVPLLDIALATVPDRDSGAASGVLNTFQQVGGAVGVAVVGVVFFGNAGRYTPDDLLGALVLAALVPVVGYSLVAISSVLLPSLSSVRAHLAHGSGAPSADDPDAVPAG